MAERDLSVYQVQDGDQALITGFVQYNSLAEKTKSKIGKDKRPRYSITLSHPKVIQGKGSIKLVQCLPTSKYFYEKNKVLHCQFISVAPDAPLLYGANIEAPKNGVPANEILVSNGSPLSLAKGQQVYVLVKAFRSRSYGTINLGLQSVKIEDLGHPLVDGSDENLFDDSTNSFNNLHVEENGRVLDVKSNYSNNKYGAGQDSELPF